MTTKYEVIEIDQTEITVDVSLLTKTEEIFFNATEMAKPFGKLPHEYLRMPSTDRYIEALIALSDGNSDKGKSRNDFIMTKRGGKYQGTWLHRKLALDFARWLSPMFAVRMDAWVEVRLKEEQSRKRDRLEARTGFLPMTNAILNAHDPVKHYHFSNEADMLNGIVIGMPAKKFREIYGVDNVRDACTAVQIRALKELQAMNTTLISLGMDYQTRKDVLTRYHNGETSLLCNAA